MTMKILTVALLMLSVQAQAQTQESWYIAHMGPETCAPLRGIGADFNRVYYGAGPFKTPDDIAGAFRKMGATVVRDHADDLMVAYRMTMATQTTVIVMFSNKRLCEQSMSLIEK